MSPVRSSILTLTFCAMLLAGCSSDGVSKEGFVTATDGDVLYVAREGTPAAAEIEESGHIAKPITAVGARVDGKKVMGGDEETLAAYLGWDDE